MGITEYHGGGSMEGVGVGIVQEEYMCSPFFLVFECFGNLIICNLFQ